MPGAGPRVAVVGHVEWVQFARVQHVPRAGEVMHGEDAFEEPAGGGAVAAVQLARLGGEATLYTALGDDDRGRRAAQRLIDLGVRMRPSWRSQETRRAVSLVDGAAQRTIVTFGARLDPVAEDAELAWEELSQMDAVYFTAGDAGALRAARAARVLVATPRAVDALGRGVALDALVLSADDAIEQRLAERARADAEVIVSTEGGDGGAYRERDGATGRWAPAPVRGEPVDAYGCGDSFAAGLTFGLARGDAFADALSLGARCGAACLVGRGPYERQLSSAEG